MLRCAELKATWAQDPNSPTGSLPFGPAPAVSTPHWPLTDDHHADGPRALPAMGILHLTEIEASVGPGGRVQLEGAAVDVLQQGMVLVPAVAQLTGCFFRHVTGQRHRLVLPDGTFWAHLDLSRCRGNIGHTGGTQPTSRPNPSEFQDCSLSA